LENFETTHVKKDGSELNFEVNSSVINYKGKKAILSMNHDITSRKMLENDIQIFNEKLRALSARLQNIRENERLNLSREMHDNIGQALTGLKMDISWLERKVINSAENKNLLLERLKAMKDLVDDSIVRVRRIATELRPTILDTFGLIAALEWMLQDLEQRSEIKCTLSAKVKDLKFDQQKTLEIFRIIQESLTNVVRHAEASKVNVNVKKRKDGFIFEVIDNGIGITEDSIINSTSLGILGMNERAAQIGGRITFEKAKKNGTIVTLIISDEN